MVSNGGLKGSGGGGCGCVGGCDGEMRRNMATLSITRLISYGMIHAEALEVLLCLLLLLATWQRHFLMFPAYLQKNTHTVLSRCTVLELYNTVNYCDRMTVVLVTDAELEVYFMSYIYSIDLIHIFQILITDVLTIFYVVDTFLQIGSG